MKTYTGKQLQFISQINRNGRGVIDLIGDHMSHLNEETFELHALSLTRKTHIAIGDSIYVVKIK